MLKHFVIIRNVSFICAVICCRYHGIRFICGSDPNTLISSTIWTFYSNKVSTRIMNETKFKLPNNFNLFNEMHAFICRMSELNRKNNLWSNQRENRTNDEIGSFGRSKNRNTIYCKRSNRCILLAIFLLWTFEGSIFTISSCIVSNSIPLPWKLILGHSSASKYVIKHRCADYEVTCHMAEGVLTSFQNSTLNKL